MDLLYAFKQNKLELHNMLCFWKFTKRNRILSGGDLENKRNFRSAYGLCFVSQRGNWSQKWTDSFFLTE